MENFEIKFQSIFLTEPYNNISHLSDGKLHTEDGYTFDIHRLQLAKNSDYFRTLFSWARNKKRREFTIPGISGKCLSEILYYIYTGDITVTACSIADLLVAADYLLLTNLYRRVKGGVKMCLSTTNSLSVFAVAQKINDEDISRQSFRLIQMQFESIVQNRGHGLVDLPADVLHKILSNCSICVHNESTIWHVIVEWIRENLTERLKYTPHLLPLLARKEVDDDLASEILQHDLIIGNAFLEDLNMRNPKFSNNLEILQNFLHNNEGIDYRIPPELHVVILKSTETVSSSLFITYDENMDLWRKFGEVNFHPISAIPIGYNVFVFSDGECLKYDLAKNQSFSLRNFRTRLRNISVVYTCGRIYVLGESCNPCGEYSFEMYNPARDYWGRGPFRLNVANAVCAAISSKIYAVGYTAYRDEMKAQVFDIKTGLWYDLPAPNVHREYISIFREPPFSLVPFREYLYLIGGGWGDWNVTGKAEIFITDANVWVEIADIQHVYRQINAVVWNERIIVFDRKVDWNKSESVVRWNEEKNNWEAFDKSSSIDLRTQMIFTLRDVDSILHITKRNRILAYDFEKSCLVSETQSQ